MTTLAQVKQVVRPLLQRNSDLALIGRLLIVKPVHHILRSVYIDRGIDPLKFVPTWSVLLLSQPHKNFGYLWGAEVRGAHGYWEITDPNVAMTMCKAIEQEALAPMRPVKTVDDFINFTSKARFPIRPLDLYPATKILVDIARGDLVAAEAICKYLRTTKGRASMPYMQERYDHLVQELCPLVAAKDKARLAELLHTCEAQSVKNLKIEKFWEPTPFPIES